MLRSLEGGQVFFLVGREVAKVAVGVAVLDGALDDAGAVGRGAREVLGRPSAAVEGGAHGAKKGAGAQSQRNTSTSTSTGKQKKARARDGQKTELRGWRRTTRMEGIAGRATCVCRSGVK